MVPYVSITGTDGHLITVAVVMLTDVGKEEAIRSLADHASHLLNGAMTPEDIVRTALAREELATSVVAEDIAFPHALTSAEAGSVVVVGSAPAGIRWDPTHGEVRLVALFAGNEADHLQSMAAMARILGPEKTRRRIAAERSADAVLSIVTDAADARSPEAAVSQPNATSARSPADAMQTAAIRAAAAELAQAIPDATPAVVAATFAAGSVPGGPDAWPGWVILEAGNRIEGGHREELTVGAFVREVAQAAVDGRFGDARTVVVLWGDPGSNRPSTIRVVPIEVDRRGPSIPGFHPLVVERVERLARDIAREGREGKPIGCFFVIADPSEIDALTHQLIVNPFQGYPPEERNVLDPALEETIKEFSKIDGAFIIAGDGTIVSAGTYVAVTPESLDHHSGEGTRHASARAITAVADTVAIAVSESTGRVSVYVGGLQVD